MATTSAVSAKWEVRRVWEWEDRDGEPQIKIEPSDGFIYDSMETASTCANIFNDQRSRSQRNAGMFYEAFVVGEA